MPKINFNAQNLSWSTAMEDYAREAIEKGMRRIAINDMAYTVKVSVVNKKTSLIKVELSGAGFRAQCTNKDFYSAMTAVVSKFKSLVLKHTKKAIAKKRSTIVFDDSTSLVEEKINDLISKEKIFVLEPCDLDTAVKNFEQTDYNFYVFKDIDDGDSVAILYKRFDDTLGIIRCR
jgi:ribosome-associated translation inhibitor RaiA